MPRTTRRLRLSCGAGENHGWLHYGGLIRAFLGEAISPAHVHADVTNAAESRRCVTPVSRSIASNATLRPALRARFYVNVRHGVSSLRWLCANPITPGN